MPLFTPSPRPGIALERFAITALGCIVQGALVFVLGVVAVSACGGADGGRFGAPGHIKLSGDETITLDLGSGNVGTSCPHDDGKKLGETVTIDLAAARIKRDRDLVACRDGRTEHATNVAQAALTMEQKAGLIARTEAIVLTTPTECRSDGGSIGFSIAKDGKVTAYYSAIAFCPIDPTQKLADGTTLAALFTEANADLP